MTELTQGSSLGLDTSAQAPVVSEPVSSVAHEAPAQSSRSFTQAEVGRIVAENKREAVETYRRLQVEQPEYWAKKYGETLPVNGNSQSSNYQTQGQANPQNSFNSSHEDVRRTVAEEVQRQMDETRNFEQRKAQEAQNQRIVADFFTKLETGSKDRYPDLVTKKLQSQLDLSKMANTVYLAHQNLDNIATADVFNHLADNPEKAVQIEQLTYFRPAAAISKLNELAKSIKENAEAAQITLPKPPLSQTKPGNSGLGSGEWTTAAAKNKYRG